MAGLEASKGPNAYRIVLLTSQSKLWCGAERRSADAGSYYKAWFEALRDRQAKARIDVRIRRLSLGNFGDAKPLNGTGGISELRIDWGPGYRVYFTRKGPVLVVLLCGGDKTTQTADIKEAVRVAKDWK